MTGIEQHRLSADERPRTLFEYTVSGAGQFPFDMLRYDAAWPADSEAAAIMGLGFYESYEQVRSVQLRSYRAPTTARWSSFSWRVE